MRKLGTIIMTAILLGLVRISLSEASWASVPLSDRIKGADLVVVGQLKVTHPRYHSITWPEYTSFYDVGRIRIEKVLKGSWHESGVGFAFDHPRQSRNPFRHMHISFQDGQRGIWILHRGVGGFFYVRRPDNFLKKDSLQEVKDALQKIAREDGSKPRIVVRRVRELGGQWRYAAHIEGKESWTRHLANSKHEAVGLVVLTHPEQLQLETEVLDSITDTSAKSDEQRSSVGAEN